MKNSVKTNKDIIEKMSQKLQNIMENRQNNYKNLQNQIVAPTFIK